MENTQLVNFFGGYFHQDWMCNGESIAQIVRQYVYERSRESTLQTISELTILLKSQKSDAELQRSLHRDFHGYLRTEPGSNYRELLEGILKDLETALEEKL
jgi:hypothetical protein